MNADPTTADRDGSDDDNRRPGSLSPGRSGRRWVWPAPSGRGATFVAAAVFLVLLAGVAALLPVPYVLLAPGLTANTLGSYKGQTLIVIDGRRTYPTAGRLELTTVEVTGSPGRSLDLVSALRGWLDPTIAVVPQEVVYPHGETTDEVRRRDAEAMSVSQQNATAAALRALDVPVKTSVVVTAVLDGAPAEGVLKAGDLILAVDGAAVSDKDQLRRLISAHRPGQVVRLTVRRDDADRTATVRTRAASDDPRRAVVGVVPDNTFRFPFTVTISVERVGGPSAGLMFSLGIIDKLTPGELNDGKSVAGTGTIAPDGAVGPIGGIQQKLVAAKRRGVDLFLAPAGNCRQVAAATPPGLRVIRVASLEEALNALAALREGRVDTLPRCTG